MTTFRLHAALGRLVEARAALLRPEELVTNTSRPFVLCCALLVSACGAGDDRLDPRDLELREKAEMVTVK